MYKLSKLFVASSLMILLVACTKEQTPEEENNEPKVEDTKDSSEQTTDELIDYPLTEDFSPTVTEVPKLTEEEQDIHGELNERISAEIEPKTTDEEFIESIADDYEEYSSEELVDLWFQGADASLYSEFGELAIYNTDWYDLIDQVVEENVNAQSVERIESQSDWNNNHTISKTEGFFSIDDQEHEAVIHLKYSDDYSQATLIYFVMDEETILDERDE